MSDADYRFAWENAERGCWEYFNRVLGTIEGITAFDGDNMPRTVPGDGADFFIWTFKINGGAVEAFRQDRTEILGGNWHMNAVLDLWTTSDALAKRLGGIILDALPVTGGDVDGIAQLYPTAWPSRTREHREVVTGDRAGDERIFYHLTQEMACAFGNTVQKL